MEKKEGERAVMEGEVYGMLVLEDKCIRVARDDNGSFLLIFPPDFTMAAENGNVEILNQDGEIKAHLGDRVHIGGGGIGSFSQIDPYVQAQVPSQCDGPYWIVGDW